MKKSSNRYNLLLVSVDWRLVIVGVADIGGTPRVVVVDLILFMYKCTCWNHSNLHGTTIISEEFPDFQVSCILLDITINLCVLGHIILVE